MTERAAAIALGLVAVLVGPACAGAPLPRAEPADGRWPGMTAADLDQGRQLYRARCAACHRPVPPSSIAADAWPAQVAEMKERAGVTPDQARSIERYLVTIASRAGS